MKNFRPLFYFFALTLAFALAACSKKSSPPPPANLTPEQMIERGKAIYAANCLACHNVDPSRDGSAGPAVAGATLELLEAKMLRSQYPAGYKPKRETSAMPAMPHLKNEIPSLAAYLSSLGISAQ
jgi:mono/diheme cytochrome c family protein